MHTGARGEDRETHRVWLLGWIDESVDPSRVVQFSCADDLEEDHALRALAAQCSRSGVTLVTFCRQDAIALSTLTRTIPAEALQDGAPREIHPILVYHAESLPGGISIQSSGHCATV